MTDLLNSAKETWKALRQEVINTAEIEPILASYLHSTVLNHKTLVGALSYLLAGKLATPYLSSMTVRDTIREVFYTSLKAQEAMVADLNAVADRDPAAQGVSDPFLHFKGFHAVQSYRVAHWLWNNCRRPLALYLQNRISELFAVDIHPAAKIGKGILIDHATGVVIGETAVVGDNVSMLHEVTLGGTGKENGDRHPKVGNGVLIGAGVKILGNVKIGDGAKIGAGSVVLHEIPPHKTVVGIPAKIVGKPLCDTPSLNMNQNFTLDFMEGI